MKISSSLKTIPWLPVGGLLGAGLLGWFLAWFTLPGQPTPNAPLHATTQASPLSAPPSGAKNGEPAGSLSTSPPRSLEQLLQSQSSTSTAPAPGPASADARQAAQAGKNQATKQAERETDKAARRRAMLELQTKTMAEIQAIKPGDTKKMMEVMTRFDAQMQIASGTSIIDLDKLRQTLEAADRMQQINQQLVAESSKGRGADPVKVQALANEMQAAQKSLPQAYIKTDALQKQLAP